MQTNNINTFLKGKIKKSKYTVFWDVDDVVLNSSIAVVDIINKKFNEPNNLKLKTTDDIKDWIMRSINRNMNSEILEDIFASPEFWSSVTVNKDFINTMNKTILSKYNHCFVTKGCPCNLKQKEEFLNNNLPFADKIKFIGVKNHISKNIVDMTNGIFIDDNIKNLIESNASIKILLTNNRQTDYNNAFGDYKNENISDIYIVSSLKQVQEILEFNIKHDLLTL